MILTDSIIIGSFYMMLNVALVRSSSYKASVVELAPKSYLIGLVQATSKQQAQQNMIPNLNLIEELSENANAQGAKIIVFPENGIVGRILCEGCKDSVRAYAENIPDIISGSTIYPCTDSAFDDRPVLKRLSCIARNHSIVLVANMPDEKGDLLFNTNVVFETDGSLIAKYYKQHLFRKEAKVFDTPNQAPNAYGYRYITFATSFGVEFSTFICNDILYCDPPLEMVKRGINNFVFSTHWGNRYPHYMSIGVRQGWSWRNEVNMLSSGINGDFEGGGMKFYSSGSGIYSAGKPIDYYISGETFTEPSGRLIIADVPLQPGNVDSIGDGQRFQLTDLNSRNTWNNFKDDSYNTLNPLESSQTVNLLNEQFECSVEYEFGIVAENEIYALAASVFTSGDLTYALCTVSRRPGDGEEPKSFGYAAASTFQYLKLSGTFSKYSQATVIPIVLGNQLRLLDPSLFILEDDQLTLQNNEQSILAVNLWTKIAGANDGYCSTMDSSGNSEARQAQNQLLFDFSLLACLFIAFICNI